MKKLLSILLFIPFLGACQTEVLGVEKGAISTDTIVWSGLMVQFIGDSYFAGNFDGGVQTIPDGFSDRNGCIVNNLGISGQVLQNGSVCGLRTIFNQTTISTYSTQAALFIALGTNDVGMNNGSFTVSGYQSTLESVIDYAHNTRGWPLKRIIIIPPYYTEQSGRDTYIGECGVVTAANATRLADYVDAGISAAITKGTQLLNIYQMQIDTGNPSALMGGDGLHPNTTTGAQFIINAMNSTYYL